MNAKKFNDLSLAPADAFLNIEKLIEASLVLFGSDNEFFIEQAMDIVAIARDYAGAAGCSQAARGKE